MDDKTFEAMMGEYKGYDLDTVCITRSVDGDYVEKCYEKGPDKLSGIIVAVLLVLILIVVIKMISDWR